MRCLVCNAEMVLMEAVLADPTILPGFEHRTFSCSACRDIERRLVFTGASQPGRAVIGALRASATLDQMKIARSSELGSSPFWEGSSRALPDPECCRGE